MNILGLDLSLNHAGLCWLVEGQAPKLDYLTTETRYIGTKLQSADAISFSDQFARLKKTHKGKDQHERYNQARLLAWSEVAVWIAQGVRQHDVGIVALEDYAYGAVSSSGLQIAEVSGLVRVALGGLARLRLYTPGQVKKWACGNGAAQKSQMLGAAAVAGLALERLTHRKGADLDGPGTDLADAYFLADLARAEDQVRRGHLLLSQLDESAIEVFNMVSKSHPVNLLARPYC